MIHQPVTNVRLPIWAIWNGSTSGARRSVPFVLTIFSPSPEDYAGVVELLEIQDFDYPVYVDFDGRFRRTNAFIPEDVRFHSFLTDGSGRIRHVGNPSVSESLEKSFDRALDGIVRESSARNDNSY